MQKLPSCAIFINVFLNLKFCLSILGTTGLRVSARNLKGLLYIQRRIFAKKLSFCYYIRVSCTFCL
jgi:hypothetical protein